MTIFNNSNKERKHFKDKRSHQEINCGATTAATLEPSTPLSPANARRTRALARLLRGAAAARVRALLSASSHSGRVFPHLNLHPLTHGAAKGVRCVRRLRSYPVISRRTQSSVLSVVVGLYVRV